MNSCDLAPAHRARVRLHGRVFQAAAIEDPAVRRAMLLVRNVQARCVDVERIGVLHRELAHPQQTALWARLVAELGLDLIPDLRQLFVAAQQPARDGRHRFFVGHRETQGPAEAVFQAEKIVAHRVPAGRFFPDFGWIQGGQVKFLRADRIHFPAHDGRDLQQRPLRQEQVAVDSGGKLADVARAQKESVAGDFRFGRVLPQRGDK